MKKIQKEINDYLVERDWHTASPADYAKSIAIEAAELLELFQWGHISADELKKDKVKYEKMQSELADVLIYCVDMLNLLGLDGTKVIQKKMEHNKKKYPVNKVKGRDHKYYEIKEQYRSKRKK